MLVVGEGQVRGDMVSELKSPEARLKPPLTVVLISHPKEGAVLFGAGLPADMNGRRLKGSALSPFTVAPGKDLASRLAAAGVSPEDVKGVILPDLAPEWAGGRGLPQRVHLHLLPGLDQPEAPGARKGHARSPSLYSGRTIENTRLFWNTPYGTFDHGIDLFKDGTIILIDLDGGVAGGMGAWVNLDSGPLLLAGPGAFVYDNIFDSALPDRKFVVDISSFMWNARAMKLVTEAAPRLVILPAHDLSTLKLSPRPDISLFP
ncbi:MAG: hypothetical protein M0D55_19230 [Elusimicrobiota bacterium]|nr:MAG: hypothetical protein M0D55_19230 [Elusimicrobiota bacterium]